MILILIKNLTKSINFIKNFEVVTNQRFINPLILPILSDRSSRLKMQKENKMKTNQGVKLVPKGLQILEVSFLADKDMLKAYQDRIKTKYNSKQAIETLDIFGKNGVVQGSNSFAIVELASPSLALPSQVLHASELNPGFFGGNYEDIGLVLRTNGDSYNPNDRNAKNLYEQLKHRGITASDESPVLISLVGLSLKEDTNSGHGLIHLLTDEAQIIQAPELSHLNNGMRFSRADERGIPIFGNEGERTFYAGQRGLVRFILNRELDLDSNWSRDLSYSDAGGRVVVVENFPSENNRLIKSYLAELKKERDKQVAELNIKYNKAVALMKG